MFNSVRRELKEHVTDLAPAIPVEMKVPFFNILLTGQIKSGKSSFYNSLNNIFSQRIVAGKADVGEEAESLTKEVSANLYK
jgi:predicted GTPase